MHLKSHGAWWLAALLLLTPVCGAAAPVSGRLALPDGARVDGPFALRTDEGAFDLAPAVLAEESLRIAWSAAQGYEILSARTVVGASGAYVGTDTSQEPGWTNRSLGLPASELTTLACKGVCQAYLFPPAGMGSIALTFDQGADVAPLASPVEFRAPRPSRDVPDNAVFDLAAGSLAAPGPSSVAFSGAITLVLWNVTGTLRGDAAGEAPFDSGITWSDHQAHGLSYAREKRERLVVLHLTGAEVSWEGPTTSRLLAPYATGAGAKGLDAAKAFGWVTFDGQRYDVHGDAVEVEGALDVAFGPRSRAPLPAAQTLLPARTEVALEGEATRVAIAGQAAPQGAREGGLAPAVLVAWTAVLLLVLAAALVPFYTRISRGGVLDNPNRRRVLDEIKGAPGLTTADVVRTLDMARGVVQHHLRILASHKLIAERRVGAIRRYFSPDQVPADEPHALQVVLADPTRRVIATTLHRAERPLSQKDLVARTGLAQRLVSHHLAKLEPFGLLVVEGGVPRRYRATARLGPALARPLGPTHDPVDGGNVDGTRHPLPPGGSAT